MLRSRSIAFSIFRRSPGGRGLFLPFKDGTSGKETYAAGRYVDLDGPDGGPFVLDFNRAYNPSCAYGEPERFQCPVPPAENALAVAVTRGRAQGRRRAGTERRIDRASRPRRADLPGRVHGLRQDHRGPRARRSGWAGSSPTPTSSSSERKDARSKRSSSNAAREGSGRRNGRLCGRFRGAQDRRRHGRRPVPGGRAARSSSAPPAGRAGSTRRSPSSRRASNQVSRGLCGRAADALARRAMFERRRAAYALADHRIDASTGGPDELAHGIEALRNSLWR